MTQEGIQEMVKKEVDNAMKKHLDELKKLCHTELVNENGNATVKQSGNGIVYVDNSGIAYAIAILFYYMSDEMKQKVELSDLLTHLNNHMGENYHHFQQLINNVMEGRDSN